MSDGIIHAAIAMTLPTPWGPCQLAVSGAGVAAMALLVPAELFDARVAARTGRQPIRPAEPEDGRDPRRTLAAEVADRLRSYLAGMRVGFADLPIDWVGRPAWDRRVLEAVRLIPNGRAASYSGIARAIGRPGAARAVGGAVGRNPVGFLVPCHRVIAADGSLGGYGGEWWGTRETLLGIKRDLLAREGVAIPAPVGAIVEIDPLGDGQTG